MTASDAEKVQAHLHLGFGDRPKFAPQSPGQRANQHLLARAVDAPVGVGEQVGALEGPGPAVGLHGDPARGGFALDLGLDPQGETTARTVGEDQGAVLVGGANQ